MRSLLFWLVCAALSSAACASPTVWLNLGALSVHSAPGYNDVNPGFGLEVRTSDTWAFTAGELKNSQRRRSRYLAAEFTPLQAGPVRLGLVAGAIDGYRLRDGKPLPLLAPMAQITWGHVALAALFIPQVQHYTDSSALALILKVGF